MSSLLLRYDGPEYLNKSFRLVIHLANGLSPPLSSSADLDPDHGVKVTLKFTQESV